MVTSSNDVTGPLRGEFTDHRWIPLTKASDAELTGPLRGEFTDHRWIFYVFFDLHLNKRFSKRSCGWWFQTPCNANSSNVPFILHSSLANHTQRFDNKIGNNSEAKLSEKITKNNKTVMRNSSWARKICVDFIVTSITKVLLIGAACFCV